MVYIVKRYNQERKERLGDPKYNGDRKENCRIIDNNDRTCQKISDSKDRKDSNIRKGSKNRSGPVMRSHDRSPVIVSFVTRTVYATLRHQFGAGYYSVVMVIEARLRQLKCSPTCGGVWVMDFIATWHISVNQIEAAGFFSRSRQLLSILDTKKLLTRP